ncbi:MAG: methylenetetrahydrofolate reductase [Alphaproteobacteria bacterium]|nr:methylenetetrahydrofolate reductase [Alphaproteobacteria bacterium]
MTNTPKPTISFEFFPAKTEEGLKKLKEDAKRLSAFDPTYMTVT